MIYLFQFCAIRNYFSKKFHFFTTWTVTALFFSHRLYIFFVFAYVSDKLGQQHSNDDKWNFSFKTKKLFFEKIPKTVFFSCCLSFIFSKLKKNSWRVGKKPGLNHTIKQNTKSIYIHEAKVTMNCNSNWGKAYG